VTKLSKPISFETTFGTYVVDVVLGEGGAGRVYGGVGPDQAAIAGCRTLRFSGCGF
jgi:hypothetical protein